MEYTVYEIVCKSNGKKYFGRSQEYEKRVRAHKNELRTCKHPNLLLLGDWVMYGEEDFAFNVLKTFESKEESVEYEQSLIVPNIGVGYNIGGATDGGDRYTNNPRRESTLIKLSERFSGSKNPRYGKKIHENARAGIVKANSKPVYVEGTVYPSVREVARQLGLPRSTAYNRVYSKSEEYSEWYYVDNKCRTTISKESRE